ncbi:MAG: DNA polymerase I [Clostridia bacterium]|nr:DNA polymerase I [Clostridia bacterium]
MKEKLLIIDGNSIANRAFYGVPLLTNSKGMYTNAIYGFLNMLSRFIDEENPTHVAITFDLKAPTFRHKKYDGYKGNRKGMPDELREQMPVLKDVIRKMGIPIFEIEGYEADDVIGTMSMCSNDYDITIISGDKDILQLATDVVKIRIPKTSKGKTTIEDYYAKDVFARYELDTKQFIDLKGLMGDSSDNIPGVKGVGEKTAIKLLKEYGSIEGVYENIDEIKGKLKEKLENDKEVAFLSRELATIYKEVPIECKFELFDKYKLLTEEVKELFKELEFKNMFVKFSVNENTIIENKKIDTVISTNTNDIGDVDELIYFIHEDVISVIKEEKVYIYINMIDEFKSLFENDNILKVGLDIKKDMHVLDKYGIEIKGNYFDILIGSYVLMPTHNLDSYSKIADEILGESYKSEEEIFGKGKSLKKYDELDNKEFENYMANVVSVIKNSKDIIIKELETSEQEDLFYNIENPLVKVLYSMEKEGFKIDKDKLIEFGNDLSKDISKLEVSIYEIAGVEFNIASPKQLAEVLFEKLKLPVIKKTKTGYSTNADVLEKLKPYSPIIDFVLEYRTLSKLRSTYVDGFLGLIDEEGKIHTTFRQALTTTGRISSTEPNLQNIPVRTEIGRNLRKFFVPANDYLVDADYSQVELRVLAHISEDETLVDAFKHDKDIHAITASGVFGINKEDVTSAQRREAKIVNFGIIYGMGAFSLSGDLNTTVKEAEKYIESYFERYPKVKEYMDTTVLKAKEDSYVKTIFGRIRRIPEINSSNFLRRSFSERVAMNTPIQGSAADIIKIAMIKVYERLEKEKLKSKLVLQVHDELIIDTVNDEVEKVEKIITEEMENATRLIVPLTVDMKTGKNWYETK